MIRPGNKRRTDSYDTIESMVAVCISAHTLYVDEQTIKALTFLTGTLATYISFVGKEIQDKSTECNNTLELSKIVLWRPFYSRALHMLDHVRVQTT